MFEVIGESTVLVADITSEKCPNLWFMNNTVQYWHLVSNTVKRSDFLNCFP